MVEAHEGNVTHRYTMHYPEHPERRNDPHYKDFNAIRKAWKKDPDKWQCAIGKHRNDFSECDNDNPLELHHAHVEFSLQNGIKEEISLPFASNCNFNGSKFLPGNTVR